MSSQRQRKPYRRPHLEVHGKIASLTQGEESNPGLDNGILCAAASLAH